jgi:hypothetical protein
MPVTIPLPPPHAQSYDPLISVVHATASKGWPHKLTTGEQVDIMQRVTDIEVPSTMKAGIVCQWPKSLAAIHPRQIRITVKYRNHHRFVTRKKIPANPLTCIVSVSIPGGRYGDTVMSFSTNIWEIWEDGSFIYTGPSTDPATD